MADESADSVPLWRELSHFKNYINENFMDGSKWEDLSKVITELMCWCAFAHSPSHQICILVMRNVLAESSDHGILLLCCVWVYIELNLLVSFDVYTDQTIMFGQERLDQFVKLVNMSHLFYTQLLLMSLNDTPGIWTRSVEHPKNAPHLTPLWWHWGKGCHSKLHFKNLWEDAWSPKGLLQVMHKLQECGWPGKQIYWCLC